MLLLLVTQQAQILIFETPWEHYMGATSSCWNFLKFISPLPESVQNECNKALNAFSTSMRSLVDDVVLVQSWKTTNCTLKHSIDCVHAAKEVPKFYEFIFMYNKQSANA